MPTSARTTPQWSSTTAPVITVSGAADGDSRHYVRGGFAEVSPTGLTVLAEVAIPLAELSAEVLAQQIRNAEEDVADAKDRQDQLLPGLLQHADLERAIHHDVGGFTRLGGGQDGGPGRKLGPAQQIVDAQ